MTKKQKTIMISAIVAFVVIMGILAGIYVSNINNKNKRNSAIPQSITNQNDKLKNLTDVQKEIAGIDTSELEKEDNEENYSELYKEYLKLSDKEKADSEVIPRKEDVPLETLDEIKKDQDIDENGLPKRFNLADKIDIKVENQGSYGLCWDFASIKALETHLAINNMGNYDFSEMHVDYITSEKFYGYRTLHEGGSFDVFRDYIIESGVVLEESVPYKEYILDMAEYDRFIELEKVVEVTATVNFPSIYKGDYAKYTDEEIAEFRETVKRHIMQNGGLYAVVKGTGEKNYYVSPTSNEWSNHAVTVVGWDDNYSKDNFTSSDGKKPSKDGAYICLNSWGTAFNDNGYYYVSYEDRYIESDLSGIVSTTKEGAYKVDSLKNPALKEYILKRFSSFIIKFDGEDYIPRNVVEKIRSLDLSNQNLTSIEGIEIFANIYDIDLSNNNIKDLTPLTKLKNLSEIKLSNNKLTDISGLSNYKNDCLYSIDLSNNNISDVSCINTIDLVNEWSTLQIDLSNNPNVKGFEKIEKVQYLTISNCNVKDVSGLKNCEKLESLIASNNPGIKGLEELSENVRTIDISNCEIDTWPSLNKAVEVLNLSKNKLTSLEGVEQLNGLFQIDISGNPITDWDSIKKIPIGVAEYYLEGDSDISHYDKSIAIIANDCNIDDITVFNDFDCRLALYLENNKITDLTQFNPNKNVYYINLSNNKNLEGLEALDGVSSVFLDDCDLSDLSEILKLQNVNDLSLENNKLSGDVSSLLNLKYLTSISLAGNKGIKGKINSETLYVLNLSNCDLRDSNYIEFSNCPYIYLFNVSKNPYLKNVSDLLNGLTASYVTYVIDEISYQEFRNIRVVYKNQYYYFNDLTINLEHNLKDGEKTIDFTNYSAIKKVMMNAFSGGNLYAKNGAIDKTGFKVNVEDTTKENVEIIFEGWSSKLSNSKIVVTINPNAKKAETTDTNTINNTTNETTDNTIDNATNTTKTTNTIDEDDTASNDTTNNLDEVNNTVENTTDINTNTQNVIENEVVQN